MTVYKLVRGDFAGVSVPEEQLGVYSSIAEAKEGAEYFRPWPRMRLSMWLDAFRWPTRRAEKDTPIWSPDAKMYIIPMDDLEYLASLARKNSARTNPGAPCRLLRAVQRMSATSNEIATDKACPLGMFGSVKEAWDFADTMIPDGFEPFDAQNSRWLPLGRANRGSAAREIGFDNVTTYRVLKAVSPATDVQMIAFGTEPVDVLEYLASFAKRNPKARSSVTTKFRTRKPKAEKNPANPAYKLTYKPYLSARSVGVEAAAREADPVILGYFETLTAAAQAADPQREDLANLGKGRALGYWHYDSLTKGSYAEVKTPRWGVVGVFTYSPVSDLEYLASLKPKAKKNPQPIPGTPFQVNVRTDRLTDRTAPLAPDIFAVEQLTATGKHAFITHFDAREFLFLKNTEGKGSYFYRSFAGTGGKQQGTWFPSGGALADQRGLGIWIIKGNPKTDPGAGRPELLAFWRRVNDALPHSDVDTDALIKRLTGIKGDDFLRQDAYELRPTLQLAEPAGNANEVQSKWGGWAYDFWAKNGLTKVWGARVPKTNPRRAAFNPAKLKKSWEVTLPPYPLAPTDVQRKLEYNWSPEYPDQYHSIHVLPNGKLCMLMEDGDAGGGLYVFEYGDWALRRAHFIDTTKTGWSLRLKTLAR